MPIEDRLWKAAKSGDLEDVKRCITEGADINSQNEVFRHTALHIAASEGHYEIAKFLIEKGADLLITDAVDMTPVHLAARDGHPDILKLLLDSVEDFPSRIMDDVIHVGQMSVYSSEFIVEMLQKYRIKFVKPSINSLSESDALLLISAHDGDISGVRKALEKGADIEVVGGRGLNPLLWASLRGRFDVVNLLLESGANINAQNRVGWTPILQASAAGHLDVVMSLLEHGADANIATEFSETALMFAAREGYREIVAALLAHGANTSVRDDDGMTAYTFAIRYGYDDIAEMIGKPESLGKKGLTQR